MEEVEKIRDDEVTLYDSKYKEGSIGNSMNEEAASKKIMPH